MKVKVVLKVVYLLFLPILMLYAGDIFADGTTKATDLAGVASNISTSFAALAKLVTSLAYVAGMGFAMAAILKFKAHKDNPTQIPIGTPIALLFVAAALLFLPSLFTVAGQSIFGSGAQVGSITGTTSFGGT